MITASAVSATVTASQAFVPAGQEPFALVAAITVSVMAIATIISTIVDRKAERRTSK